MKLWSFIEEVAVPIVGVFLGIFLLIGSLRFMLWCFEFWFGATK